MNKFFYICGFFICFLVTIFFVRSLQKPPGESEINCRLREELKDVYPDKTNSLSTAMWSQLYLDNTGLTYSFNALVLLTDFKTNSTDDAEKIYAKVYSDYQNKLNSIPFIRPFLCEFPMTLKFFRLGISFDEANGKCVKPPYIATVGDKPDDTLSFTTYSPEKKEHYTSIFKKPIVKSKYLQPYLNPAVERIISSPERTAIPMPVVDKTWPPRWKSLLNLFMIPFAERYHLLPLTLGKIEEEESSQYYPCCFCFWGKEKLEFDQAHFIGASCAKDVLKFLRKDKASLNFMKTMRDSPSIYHEKAMIPEPRHIKFRISFWDEGINRRESPCIAEIRFSREKFKYFTSDEGQRLVLVHEESFEEAMKFLEENNGSGE